MESGATVVEAAVAKVAAAGAAGATEFKVPSPASPGAGGAPVSEGPAADGHAAEGHAEPEGTLTGGMGSRRTDEGTSGRGDRRATISWISGFLFARAR